MSDDADAEARAIEALQSLGCREYEAKCYVALTRLSTGTAKDISQVTDIPRTRVYDAMEDLLEKGLVEVHYSTPKRYRAVPIEDAVAWFRHRYESHLDQFEGSVASLSQAHPDASGSDLEVWSIAGLEAILVRANNLVQSADREVLFYLTAGDRFDREVLQLLEATELQGTTATVAVPSPAVREFVTEHLEDASATTVEVDVPVATINEDAETAQPLSMLLGDGESLLLRTSPPELGHAGSGTDRAIVAEGRTGAVVAWVRHFFGV